ncbi:probable ATP-dependent RNA helicase DDX52 isoform X1 [Pimephales promelas]|uniref:probable ATP-dependent RNA helicase DDX52 isoform X1 n=1 Tax=Pimephales promelas TaxID=90988 RepID=UPI0019557215|nr:probable ATP-dependent RNA helicase DDX52 isoform X1 [Pimephales promelas]KAG1943556.1 P-loop containing nucleoside triphosphate hydrolases superfamily protein [Pimephales promelas]
MDAVDLFRKLGSGAKFDLKRFAKDAERFKVVKSQSKYSSQQLAETSFFGTETLEKASPQSRLSEDDGEEEKEGSDEEQASGKRKRTEVDEPVKAARKKKKGAKRKSEDTEPEKREEEGIQWMSSQDTVKDPKKESKDTLSLKRLKQLHQEKVNRVRNQNRINVHGTDIPDPVSTFEELQKEYDLDPRVIQNIKTAGFQTPTPIQMQAIPLMMHKREILACAPTGSGKTMAFCLPLLAHLRQPLNKGFRALIISPTRELATQTHRELLKLSEGVGFRVHMINKGVDAVKKYGPKSAKKFDILVTTPNRLIYLLNQDPPAINLSCVEWLVVDESDKLFEDGKRGFREQLATIFLACSSPKICRVLFSATFATDVEKWCKLNLDNLVSVNIGPRNSAVDTVEQQLLFVGSENGKLLAMRNLIKQGFLPPVLIFVQSIDRARELFHELVYEGINVDVIHADRTQQQRDNVVSSFRSGKIWVLICTALLARGIDFKGVNLVINYDFPTTAVDYIHRIGRTGRAGHKGKAITLFTEDDKPLLRSIATVIKKAGCPVPDYMIGLKKIKRKLKRQLVTKPPRRSTIRTTPRMLFEKKIGMGKRKKRKVAEKEAEAKGKPSEVASNS